MEETSLPPVKTHHRRRRRCQIKTQTPSRSNPHQPTPDSAKLINRPSKTQSQRKEETQAAGGVPAERMGHRGLRSDNSRR